MKSTIIGLTGPTGAGKSTIAATAAEHGFYVIDCDIVARQAVEKGKPALVALCKAFGQEILLSDGRLNRKKLAEISFKSPKKTELLNHTILPFIVEEINEIINNSPKDKTILLDAPTLFESGADSMCNKVIAVIASSSLKRDRIIKRDNLTLNQAVVRLSAVKKDDYYLSRTEHVLYNNGNKEQFLESALKMLKELE